MNIVILIPVVISALLAIASGVWVALALVRALTARPTSVDTHPQNSQPNTEEGPQI